MPRHFLRDDDISRNELNEILAEAIRLKKNPYASKALAGPKNVALIFDKTSTRTRVSFSAGVAHLQGNTILMEAGQSQLGAKESIADTARVLNGMVEMIVWRTFAHSGLEEMARYARVPVINALSDDFHPCQILADLLTIHEHFGGFDGVRVAYVGDAANNMGNSYVLGFGQAGLDVRIGAPEDFQPRADVLECGRSLAAQNGGSVEVVSDPQKAVADADVVITDTWVSMGQEAEKAERVRLFADYRVSEELFAAAKEDAVFMHCLPAYREYEVAPSVIDGPRSLVWQEAENRLHAQKALMKFLIEG